MMEINLKKCVNPKMRGRKLRSSVNRQGALKQKKKKKKA